MRFRSTSLLMATVALATVMSTGCASTARISQFDTFATAGNSYATAMDGLLTEAEEVLVDTNSKKFLWSQRLSLSMAGPTDEQKDRARAILLNDVEGSGGLLDMDNAMRDNITAYEAVRSQVSLLAAYFSQLAGLAKTGAAEVFGAQLAGSVDSINALSGSLGSTAIGNAVGAKKMAQTVGSAITRAVQAKSLEQELELRGAAIDTVLEVHAALLDALKSQIAADLDVARKREYESRVEEPLVDGRATKDPASEQLWIDNRRQLLAPAPLNQKVNATISGLQMLRTAWTKLQTDSLTVSDVQAVLDDLQPVIAAAEALKEQP